MTVLYHSRWLGALVITGVALAVSLACRRLASSAGSAWRELLSTLGAIGVLMMYNHYDEPTAMCLALAVCLWFAVVYLSFNRLGSAGRSAVYCALFFLLYWMVGGAAFLFALLAAMFESRGPGRFVLPPLYLVFGAVCVYLLNTAIFDLPAYQAYTILLPVDQRLSALILAAASVLYAYIILFVLAGVLWRRRKTPATRPRAKGAVHGQALFPVSAALALVVACGSTLFLTHDEAKSQMIQLNYLSLQARWKDVLVKAKEIPSDLCDISCIHNVDKALYYSGQLNERMFEFPHYMPALLLVYVKGITSGQVYLDRMSLFYNLGHINTAEHLAFEILENSGESPLVLETLAKINLVKGQTETAKVFLRKMAQNPISASRARRILRELEKDPLLSDDPQLQYLRSVAIKDRTAESGFDSDKFFGSLLDRNYRNKMAVEYMMASYLLLGEVDKIAANIHRLGDIGYDKVPRYLEEALVIYLESGDKSVYIDKRWLPGSDALKRAKEFSFIAARFDPADRGAAMNALAKDFGDSYYFYFVFNLQR